MATMADAVATLQVNAELAKRAAEVLESEGLTVTEAVEQLLVRIATEGALPFSPHADAEDEDPAYDAWYRAKVQASLDDTRPGISHEEMGQRMEARHAAARERLRVLQTQ